MFVSKKKITAMAEATLGVGLQAIQMEAEARFWYLLYKSTEEGQVAVEHALKPCANGCGHTAAVMPAYDEDGRPTIAAGLLCFSCKSAVSQ